eukprot:TRINITY_DN29869_c0_g3_i1.p1 TRINITY_DN29869_c0_g3~~TRINITY_DN29869_c0_g3_i1.p1  ORF type:complete len:1053 (+),score=216.57 TRINITY_DN29869_c0_g3_i1:87-3245(+)
MSASPGARALLSKGPRSHWQQLAVNDCSGGTRGHYQSDSSTFADTIRRFRTRGHEGRAQCVASSGTLDYLVSGGKDGTVRVWCYDEESSSYDLHSIVVHYPDEPPPVTPATTTSQGAAGDIEMQPVEKAVSSMALLDLLSFEEEDSGKVGVTAVHFCQSTLPLRSGELVKLDVDSEYIKECMVFHGDDVYWEGDLMRSMCAQVFTVQSFDKARNIVELDCNENSPPGGEAQLKLFPAECVDRISGDAPVRDGPVLSGTATGDLTVLCMAEQGLEVFKKLHEGPVNSITAVPIGDTQDDFLVITGGEDGYLSMLDMRCEEATADSRVTLNHSATAIEGIGADGRYAFLGGDKQEEGGIDAASPADAEALKHRLLSIKRRYDEAGRPVKIRHESKDGELLPVLHVKTLGEYPNGVAFASLARDGVRLFTLDGTELMKLEITHPVLIYHPRSEGGEQMIEPEISEYTEIAVVNKYNGSLLFVTGIGKHCKEGHGQGTHPGGDHAASWTAVWYVSGGMVAKALVNDKKAQQKEWEEALAEYRRNGATIKPVTAYKNAGRARLTDIDKCGESTCFAVDIRRDFTAVMWNLEGCSPDYLAVNMATPASLLVMPGREKIKLEMLHSSKVNALEVVEDPDETGANGPALVTACEDGTVYVWDLDGKDQGQVYVEVRSLGLLEIVLPPLLLLISGAQVLSFAFGPDIPGVPKHTREVAHSFATGDFLVPVTDMHVSIVITDVLVFWVKTRAVIGIMVVFIFCALLGMPELCNSFLRSMQSNHRFKKEQQSDSYCAPMHLLLSSLRTFQGLVLLMMRLCATILVVPMVTAVANAVDCMHHNAEKTTPCFIDGSCYLTAAPSVQCYRTRHLDLVLTLLVVVPLYFFLLVPYAACAGDAHYVPRSTLYDWKIWREENMWRRASRRKATEMNLGILHPTPEYTFVTLIWELMAKTLLPVITILSTRMPRLQMICVTSIGAVSLMLCVLYPPFLSGRYLALVRSLKFFTLCAMVCGLMTVFLDKHSIYPLIFLGVTSCLVFGGTLHQVWTCVPRTRTVHVYAPKFE